MPQALPVIACIADPQRRHAFYWAFYAECWDKLADAYTELGLIFEPAEFADTRVLEATAAWLADATRTEDKPMLVLIGSTEDGDWVVWNLTELPLPDVPEPGASRACVRAKASGPVPGDEGSAS